MLRSCNSDSVGGAHCSGTPFPGPPPTCSACGIRGNPGGSLVARCSGAGAFIRSVSLEFTRQNRGFPFAARRFFGSCLPAAGNIFAGPPPSRSSAFPGLGVGVATVLKLPNPPRETPFKTTGERLAGGVRTRHPALRVEFNHFCTGSRLSFRVEGPAGFKRFADDAEKLVGDAGRR